MSGSLQRLRFDRADLLQQDEQQCSVQVMLSFAGRAIQAVATGSSDGNGILRAAATATLSAIIDAAQSRFTGSLADVDHVNALGKDLIAVLVDIDFEGKQVQVFGSCQISGSETDAAVKAVLNATNRFFELAMRG